jgi:hypothetical protein
MMQFVEVRGTVAPDSEDPEIGSPGSAAGCVRTRVCKYA